MEAIQVFYDPSDLSRIYNSRGELIKKGYRKFFKKARKNLKIKRVGK
jgi:hypothetical protein